MPFATVAVPFDAYAALSTPQHRWVLLCLARYADREGRCWPSMRQLAADSRMSLATVCRYLKSMADLGVFHRVRQGVGRYRYTLAEAYVPRWKPRVSSSEKPVPQDGNPQKSTDKKHDYVKRSIAHSGSYDDSSRWQARLRAWEKSGGTFWPPFAGPRPGERGCGAPQDMIARAIAAVVTANPLAAAPAEP